jgi:hypothetical protein
VGPINDSGGPQITAGGKPSPGSADAEDLYAFHLDVPREARALELAFDLVTAAGEARGLLARHRLRAPRCA